jgi:internalin A
LYTKLFIENISSLSNLTNLKILDLSNNPITDYSYLKTLQNLECLTIGTKHLGVYYSNTINSIEFLLNLKKIIKLDLANKSLSNLTFIASLINLKELNLAYNKITDLEHLRTLISLRYLDLEHNPSLIHIEQLRFLTNLEYLNIVNTAIDNIHPLKELISLHTLEVSLEHYTDINAFKDLHNLRKLIVHIYSEKGLSIIKLIKSQLKNCSIEIKDYSIEIKDYYNLPF